MNGILAYLGLQHIAKILDIRACYLMFLFGGKLCFDKEKYVTLDFLRFFCLKICNFCDLQVILGIVLSINPANKLHMRECFD